MSDCGFAHIGEDFTCDECGECVSCGDCVCEDDWEEDYEYQDRLGDLATAPPSKAYPRILDIDPDTLPF